MCVSAPSMAQASPPLSGERRLLFVYVWNSAVFGYVPVRVSFGVLEENSLLDEANRRTSCPNNTRCTTRNRASERWPQHGREHPTGMNNRDVALCLNGYWSSTGHEHQTSESETPKACCEFNQFNKRTSTGDGRVVYFIFTSFFFKHYIQKKHYDKAMESLLEETSHWDAKISFAMQTCVKTKNSYTKLFIIDIESYWERKS